AIRPRPHVVAGLAGNDQLVTKGGQVLAQHTAEVLFGRAGRRPIVVGQVEVGDAQIEGAAQQGAAVLKDIHAAKVVPQSQRDGWELQTAATGAVVVHGRVTLLRGGIHAGKDSARRRWLSIRIVCFDGRILYTDDTDRTDHTDTLWF